MSSHLNDTGTELIIDVGEDISSATVKKFRIKKPGPRGTLLTVDAAFVNDGADGLLKYTFAPGDRDVPGIYRTQAYIETPGGAWSGEIEDSFRVKNNLS
jgi:hypothetical protein